MPLLKLARDLVVGDEAVVWDGQFSSDFVGTVRSIVPEERMIKRRYLVVTFQRADGQSVQRRYGEHSTVHMHTHSTEESDS